MFCDLRQVLLLIVKEPQDEGLALADPKLLQGLLLPNIQASQSQLWWVFDQNIVDSDLHVWFCWWFSVNIKLMQFEDQVVWEGGKVPPDLLDHICPPWCSWHLQLRQPDNHRDDDDDIAHQCKTHNNNNHLVLTSPAICRTVIVLVSGWGSGLPSIAPWEDRKDMQHPIVTTPGFLCTVGFLYWTGSYFFLLFRFSHLYFLILVFILFENNLLLCLGKQFDKPRTCPSNFSRVPQLSVGWGT